MIDLDAIRRRDRADEHCAKCGCSRSGHRTDSLSTCNRRLARQAAKQCAQPRTCGDPDAHHKFKPGGGWYDWNGEADRHALLVYIDGMEDAR